MHSHSQFVSWHNRSDWVVFTDGCAYHECRLGAAFVPELEGKFFATENFYHTSKVLSFPFGWTLLKKLYFKLNVGKRAGATFLSWSPLSFIFNIQSQMIHYSSLIFDRLTLLWSVFNVLPFLIWWWLWRSFAMGIGQRLRSTILSMRESSFSFVSRQHILLLYYMIL